VDKAFMQIVSEIHDQIIKSTKASNINNGSNAQETLSNSILATMSARKGRGHSHIAQGVRLE
jgi:hypothetical protein